MKTYPTLKIFTDGGSRGNPGPSASGVVILTPDDEVLEAFGVFLGHNTNNFAEYSALKFGLEAVGKYQPEVVECYLDSELVVKQLNGIYRIKNPELRPIFNEIQALSKRFTASFTHVRREYNRLADAEVNKALDEATGLKKARH